MKNYSAITITALIFLMLTTSGGMAKKAKLPKHPSKISYKKLDWEIPLGSPYRTTLSNGLRLYIAEDHSLPLVTVSGYFNTGSIKDPSGKEGLGGFAAYLMRTGGTKAIQSDTLDALIEHFAISVSLSLSNTQLVLKTQFLSQFIDTALYILDQILFHPTFEKEKIEKEREITIQSIKHRFDNPEPIIGAAYATNMYPRMANSRLSTETSMKAVTRDDLVAFHKEVFKTENVILAVSGDIDKKKFIKKLETIFPKALKDTVPFDFPPVAVKPAVKFLIVHKEISQAYIRLGLPLFSRPHPDYYAMTIFNHVLGGGSFTARLVAKVRSDAGLTYSIYSSAGSNYIFPATFYINFFTNHPSVNKAIALTLKEVEKIVKEGITKEELDNAKKVMIDGLPSMFRSNDDIVDTYSWSEYYNRSEDHYRVYPDKIKALSQKDILKAARKYINPESFTFSVVGDTTQLFKAEESDGFSLKKQAEVKIITPDMLYNPKLFLKRK